MNHPTDPTASDDKYLDFLTEDDMVLLDCEETWLVPGFTPNEDDQLFKFSNGPRVQFKAQISTSRSVPESKRHARFKTQVIKYEESLGDLEELELEPPPSFSSLDDFVPEKLPTTLMSSFKANDYINTTVTVQHCSVGSPAPTAPLKSSVLGRIQAIKMKYATPKPMDKNSVTTPDSDDEEANGSPLLTIDNVQLNKADQINRTFEEVPISKPSSLNRTFEEVPTSKLSLNRTFEEVPTNKSFLFNKTFEDIQINKLSLLNKRVEDVQNNKSSLRTFEEICPNKLSLMNNNLFVATSPTPSIETSRSLTNIHEQVAPKPTLKKQGTFEILDNIDDENYKTACNDDDGDDDGRYQTMILPQRDSGSTNGSFGKEFIPLLSQSSTPNIKALKSRKQAMCSEERQMNTSYIVEKHENNTSTCKSNTSITYLNGSPHSSSPEDTSEETNHMNRSFVVARYCDAVEQSEAASTEEFNANEAHMNANEAHMNRLNESFTLLSRREGNNLGHDLNASFTVEKHEDQYTEHNTSDINDNIVNGKVIRAKANTVTSSTNTYRTFTRPKKAPSVTGGTFRNGTSGLQKKSIMKPTTANLNTTYCSEPAANPNQTVVNTNNKYSNPSRFSTMTRPKSKLSYVGQTQLKAPPSSMLRLKNSSSTESLKSNESYVISRPNGLRAPGVAIQNKRAIYKSTGSLNVNGPRVIAQSKVQSTENLSVKSGGSDSEGSTTGSGIPRPQSGLMRPGFSRIPAPASRIPAAYSSKTSMLQKYATSRRV